MEHWFYHLQHSALEAVLPDILEKIYAKNWRALVKFGALADGNILEYFDKYLWQYKQNSFLPHGRDDEPQSGLQPVLLSNSARDTSGFDVLVLVKGAEIDDYGNIKRCITIIDGSDEKDRQIARARWKQAGSEGIKTCYWQQNASGHWVQPQI